MKRYRANPSRIPPRPAPVKQDVPGDGPSYRRIGQETAQRWQKSLSGIPRWGRLLIVMVLSLAVTLLVFPQVDAAYLTYFYNENTVILPAFVSAGCGLLMYIAGWFLVVGSTAYKPHEQVSSSPVLLWYIGLGVIALIVCTMLLLHGLTLTDAVAGITFDTTS